MGGPRYWVGFDFGSLQTNICILDQNGSPVVETACETSLPAISAILSAVPTNEIALIAAEAGTQIHIVRKLRDAGMPIAIFETRKASKFLAIRRSKSDASDAKGLADLARLGRNTVSQVFVKSLECQQLRNQIAMRHKLVKLRVIAENALRSRFGLYGKRLKRTRTAKRIREWAETLLVELKAEEGVDLTTEIMPLIELCESLRRYLDTLDRHFVEKALNDPVCQRWMGIPGVGPLTALSFYSAIEDPSRFRRTSDVGAYLGLVPRRYQSGNTSFTKGITKTGSKLTRMHLVNAASVFTRHAPDCELQAWWAALAERTGRKRAQIALARKLSIILLTLWKTGSGFEPHPHACKEANNRDRPDFATDAEAF